MFDDFVAQIHNFGDLPFNWDGHGGIPPVKATIHDAVKMLQHMPRLPSRVGVSGDGEISIIFDNTKMFADFGVYGDGRYSAYVTDRSTQHYIDDEMIENGLSKEIEQVIMQNCNIYSFI